MNGFLGLVMSNSWVVITGASRGLGAFLSNSFWLRGWNVALIARNRNDLLHLYSSMPKRPDQRAIFFQCDLSSADEVNLLVKKIKGQLPRLDALINNAAIHGPIGPFLQNNLTLWHKALQVNLMSPVTLCHGLIGFIANSGGGSVINISGGGATSPRAHFSAYSSSKAALVRFSETLAKEVWPHVRVNCIAPGAMKTRLLEEVVVSGKIIAGMDEFETAERVFVQGGAPMDRVADLALFLASDISRDITGKLVSAVWDKWEEWPKHIEELQASDIYTLRRISCRDRGMEWGDV